MSFDLYLWPADRAMTWEEASAELDRMDSGWRLGLGHDRRLDPFLRALRARYPGIGRGPLGPPVELNVHRRHVFLSIGWSEVEAMVPVISGLAWGTGLAVVDPQREVVGLPAPMADAPLGAEGLDGHVRRAEQMLGAIIAGAMSGGGFGDAAAERAIAEQLRAIGAKAMSPLGFEVTPDLAEEVRARPDRVPASLQTAAWRDELVASLRGTDVGARHRALLTIGGWDRDPVVAAALRPLLTSEDVMEAGLAATALARQADVTDLPAVMDLVHRFSPAEGGSAEAMLMPLHAALELSGLASPEIVAGVKARARGWRGPAPRTRPLEDSADSALDALLEA